MSSPKTRGNALSRAWWMLMAVPVLVHYGLIFQYGINIPKWDDHALRNFLVSFTGAESWSEQSGLLLAQHNEHRIVYDRVVVLILHLFSGEINFVWLMAIGSLSLMGTLVVFFRVVRENLPSLVAFLPLPFLLVTFQHHENTLWGMAALQNFTVVFFTLCAIYCASKAAKRLFGWALLFSISALLTSGNGLVAWPVVAVLWTVQKRWKLLGFWLLASVTAVGLYFANYEKPPGNPPATTVPVWQYGRGVLALLGAVADWQPASPHRFAGPVLVGGVLLVLAAVLNWNALRRTPWFSGNAQAADYFLVGVTMFVFATALVVAVGRMGFGEAVLLTSRIKIYSAVFLMALVVATLREVPSPWQTRAGFGLLGVSVVFWLGTAWVEWEEIVFARHERIAWLHNWQQERGGEVLPAYDRLSFPYRAPELAFFAENPHNLPTRLPVRVAQRPDQSWLVTNDSLASPVGPEAGAYLLLKGPESVRLLPTRQNRNLSRRSLLRGEGYFAPGFTAAINPTDVPPGRYEVFVRRTTDGEQARTYATGEFLTLKPASPSNLPKNW